MKRDPMKEGQEESRPSHSKFWSLFRPNPSSITVHLHPPSPRTSGLALLLPMERAVHLSGSLLEEDSVGDRQESCCVLSHVSTLGTHSKHTRKASILMSPWSIEI